MVFLINFMNHSYQFNWRPNVVSCSKCAEVYAEAKDNMFRFVRQLVLSKNIAVVFEEGGTCLDIRDVLRAHGNETTIAQEVIASISGRSISHFFVDITEEEAEALVDAGIIADITELRSHQCELRDSYMVRTCLTRLADNRDEPVLFLCADRHFIGVKRCLEEAGVSAVSDTVARFEWYISNDQIDSIHMNDHNATEYDR
jgi:hypothetical protein